MNTYQPPSSIIEPLLRTLQPPWVFMANLDITDGESMQRVAQYFYYKLHHDSNEDLVTMLGLDEVEAREVQRMYVESQESELLQGMLKWFGAFHDQAERRLIKNAETLSRAVTIHVREPKQYTVGYEHAKILWEKVLKGVDPHVENKRKKVSAPRQPKKTTPSVAKPKTVKKTGGAKVATCRIVVEDEDEDEATTYFDGDIYEEPEECDDDMNVDEESEEESDCDADFGADAMDIDFIPFPSSQPPTNNRKRRLEVEERASSSSEESMLPPPSLTPARGRGRSLVLPPTMSTPAKPMPAKGKGRGKTSMPPPPRMISPPPKERKKTQKRKTSDTSSTSSDLPYRVSQHPLPPSLTQEANAA